MLKRLAKSCVAIVFIMSWLICNATPSASFSLPAMASDLTSKREIEKEDLSSIDDAIRTKDGPKLLTLWESLLSEPIAESIPVTQRMIGTMTILLSLRQNSASIVRTSKLNRDFMRYSSQYGLSRKIQSDLIKKLQLFEGQDSQIVETTEYNLKLFSDIESRREFLVRNIEARKRSIFGQGRYLHFDSEVLRDPPPLSTESERGELRMLLQRTQELSAGNDVEESSLYLLIATYQFYLSQYDDVLVSLEHYYERVRAGKRDSSGQSRNKWIWHDLIPAMELIRGFAAMKNFFRAEQAAYMFMNLVSIPDELKRTPVTSAPEVFQSYAEKKRNSIYDVHRALALQNTRTALSKGEALQAYCRMEIAKLDNIRHVLASVNRELSKEKLKVTRNSCKRSIQNQTNKNYPKKTSTRGFFAQEQSILWDNYMEIVLSEEKNKVTSDQKIKKVFESENARTTPQVSTKNEANEQNNTEQRVSERTSEPSIWWYLFAVPATVLVAPCLGLASLMPKSGSSTSRSLLNDSSAATISVATCAGTSVLGTTSLLGAHLAEKRAEAIQFIAWNRETLVREFALRRGDFLSAFFDSLSLDVKQQRRLAELIAENHSFIFSDQDPILIFDRMIQMAEFEFADV